MDEDLKRKLRAKFAFMSSIEDQKRFDELIKNSIKKGEAEAKTKAEAKAYEERMKLN